MDNPDIDYMQPTSESELKDQLEDILSGIISTLDIYDVIDNGSTYDIINLKNSNMLYEDINLKIVANIIASALNTGEEVNQSSIDKVLETEKYAVSKMVEVKIYEELTESSDNFDRLTIYETKLTEAEHTYRQENFTKKQKLIEKILLLKSAYTTIEQMFKQEIKNAEDNRGFLCNSKTDDKMSPEKLNNFIKKLMDPFNNKNVDEDFN